MALEPLPASVPERTVRDLLERNVRQNPDRVALIAHSQDEGERQLTYRRLEEESGLIAGALAERGVRKGDRVGILVDNWGVADAFTTYFASHRIGAINVPLNARYVARELEYVMTFSGVKAVVFSSPYADLLRELEGKIPTEVFLEATEKPVYGESLYAACRRASTPEPEPLSEYDDADYIFTSGTTANPKCVGLTHANSVACAYQSQCLWDAGESTVFQNVAPFYTSTACHTNLLGVLAAGCTYVVDPEFEATDLVRRLERHRTTCTYIVSGLLQLIMQRVDLDQFDISSLRRIVYGAQPASLQFHERMQEEMVQRRGIEMVHVWGLTEGGTAGTFLRPEEHAEGVRRIGEHGLSIGRAGFNEWIKIRLLNDDDQACNRGEPGEICLRSPSVMDRYVNDSEATAAALRGGWLHTGDLAVADEDGYLYFVDRKKHMIRRGGLNISSAEVESVLMDHPAIEEVAVVAMPNPILGEEVRAVVVLKPGMELSADDILAYAAQYLADYKVPKEVVFMDSLPHNAMGRVIKGILKGEGSAIQA